MRISVCGILVAVAVTTAVNAFANAADDGNAGLDALSNGNYHKAVLLFTRALKSGELAGDDREFAYFNRGKAYIGEGKSANAIADIQAALKLKPDDIDAQAALTQAQSLQPIRSGSSHAAALGNEGHGWGFLASLAGRYYWVDEEGKDPHQAMIYYEWAQPQQVLRYTLRSKRKKIASGEYKLDAATGKLVEVEAFTSGIYYGTASASQSGVTDYFFIENIPLRGMTVIATDGSRSETNQKYLDGTWQNLTTTRYVEASVAEVESSGFFKNKKK